MNGDTLAWLAGLLEGEGYFGMIKNHVGGKVYRYPRIGVSMTDKDVIDRVGALWGVKTFILQPAISGRKTQYRVTVSGGSAATWMRDLLPWMGARRSRRITEILAEYDAREPVQVRRARACSKAVAGRPRYEDGTFAPRAAWPNE
jgi:hypothetical protein